MIPVLYSADQLTYTTNGIGRLVEAISCKVTEELNGIFELEMEYPVNGKYYPQIQNGGIIGVIYNGKLQPFDINKLTIKSDGICTVNASHVSNRLAFNWTVGFGYDTTVDIIIQQLNAIAQAPYASNFHFYTDLASTDPVFFPHIVNAKEMLGSLAEQFAAELEYDVRDAKLLTRRGTDTGLKVAYGKNVEELDREIDWSGTWNGICPYYESETTLISTITAQEAIQVVPQTPLIPAYVNFYEEIGDHVPTEQELHDAGVAYMNAHQPWIPSDSTQAIVLEVTDDDPVKDLRIGDTLTVLFTQSGTIKENARVVGVEYNVLLERNNNVTVGTPKKEYVAISGIEGDRFVTYPDFNAKLANYPTKAEMSNLFSVSTVSGSITVAANNANDVTLTGSKSGYRPIGVVGVDSQSTGSASAIIKDCYISASGDGTVSVYMQVRNIAGSQYSGTVVAYVLWAKNF